VYKFQEYPYEYPKFHNYDQFEKCCCVIFSALEDHGLQDAVSSGVEDQRVQTPPVPVHHSPALLQECFKVLALISYT